MKRSTFAFCLRLLGATGLAALVVSGCGQKEARDGLTSRPHASAGAIVPPAPPQGAHEEEEEEEDEGEKAEQHTAADLKLFLGAVEQRQRLKAGVIPGWDASKLSGPFKTLTAQPFDSNWTNIGPKNYLANPIGGRINAIAALGDGSQLFVASASGGVMKSTDAGVRWTPVSDSWPNPAAASLAAKSSGGQITVFAGASYGGTGIKRSTDGGTTWTTVAATLFTARIVSDIAIDPDNAQHVYAVGGFGSGINNAIFASDDDGLTWAARTPLAGATFNNISIGVADASGNRAYYAANDDMFLYRSLDHGVTWATVTLPTGAYNDRVAASQADPDVAYVMSWTAAKLYKTSDRGATWVETTNGFNSWGEGSALGAAYKAPGQDLVVAANSAQLRSVNAVGPWTSLTPVSNNAGWDFRRAHVAPNPSVLFLGHDAGVTKYNAALDQVSNLNANLTTHLCLTVSAHPTDANSYITGTQDTGIAHASGNLAAWSGTGAGDATGGPINKVTGAQQFRGVAGNLVMSTDGWLTNQSITPTPISLGYDPYYPDSIRLYAPVVVDYTATPRLYVGSKRLNRYDTATGTWTLGLGNQWFTNLRSIAIAPSDPQRIYAGEWGLLRMSADGGATWTRIDQGSVGLPASGDISSISVHPSNPSSILVTLQQAGGPHVWQLTNTQAADRVWQNVSGTGTGALPDFDTYVVERHPDRPESYWFVGTAGGAMMTLDAGATWEDISGPRGLPHIRVSDLDLQLGTNPRYLVAATYGRGIWRLALPVIAGSANLCENGVLDSGEADIDCGGPCPVCGPARCVDGIKQGRETAIDCGGGYCSPCTAGKACSLHADCRAGMACRSGTCQYATTCSDGVRSGSWSAGESDIDCGGPCAPCAEGKMCRAASDCQRGQACLGGQCYALSSCTNSGQDAPETDYNCGGGACAPCKDRKGCAIPEDCRVGSTCIEGTCRVAVIPATCSDGVQTGPYSTGETSVDCGGPCMPCKTEGAACLEKGDCAEKLGLACWGGECWPGQTCTNHLRDVYETSVDCGGDFCAACGLGAACAVNKDCASNLVCISSTCRAAP